MKAAGLRSSSKKLQTASTKVNIFIESEKQLQITRAEPRAHITPRSGDLEHVKWGHKQVTKINWKYDRDKDARNKDSLFYVLMRTVANILVVIVNHIFLTKRDYNVPPAAEGEEKFRTSLCISITAQFESEFRMNGIMLIFALVVDKIGTRK